MSTPVLVTPPSGQLVLTTIAPVVRARSSFNMGTVMDAIATQVVAKGIAKTAYGYPTPNPVIPCAFVAYPTTIEWMTVSGGGGVHAIFPLYFVVGNVLERASRDALSLVIDGTNSIKQSLEGNLAGVISDCVVNSVAIETIIIGDVEYLTAKFELDIFP